MPEVTGTQDLRSYFRALWRWKWLFLAFVIAAPAIAYGLEHNKPKVYKSSALVGVNQTTVNTSLLNNSGSFSTTNVDAIAQIVTTTPVADVAAGLMSPPANPSQIVGEVSATGDTSTNFLTITATDRNPTRAAAIANAFARAISLNLQKSAVSQIDATISGIQAQLAKLSPHDTTTRPALESQLNQLLAARSTQGGEAAILQAATPSSTPAGTSLRRILELALLIGILLGLGAVVLAESMDRRLRAPEDLEAVSDLPLLAAIPPSAFSASLQTTPEDEEAFNMLRTALMYFNVDKPLASILVTSAGEKDGKTTVASRLAIAAAQAGLEVALVDGDLRRAQVTSRFDINSKSGFAAAIAGEASLKDVLVEVPIETQSAEGRLVLVPAGSPPPNPSALLASDRAVALIRELEADNDLVIIDTPAALAVSDPLPLVRRVSGVVMIARMNHTTRQTVRRLQKILQSAHGTLLGVVATGVTHGPGYEHYYPKYYSSNGDGPHGRRRLGRRRGSRKAKAAAAATASPTAAAAAPPAAAAGATASPAAAPAPAPPPTPPAPEEKAAETSQE